MDAITTIEGAERTEDALKVKYIRIIRIFLSSTSAWPSEELGGKLNWVSRIYRHYLPIQCTVVWFGEIYYMATNELDMLEFGDCLLTWLLTKILLMRLIFPLLKRYKETIRDFIMCFHLIHFKHKGIHFAKVHKIIEKVSQYFTIYMSIMAITGGTLYNLSPVYATYLNGAFSQDNRHNSTLYVYSIYFNYPFYNLLTHYKTYAIFCLYCSIVVTISLCVIDLMVLLMAFHIIGHVIILRKNLESISEPRKTRNFQLIRENRILSVQCATYTEEENEKIGIILKDCVDHHRFIVRFADNMSDLFGPKLAANYTFQMVGLCILLLESTQGDLSALIRFGPLTCIIFGQLVTISVIFEIIKTVSEKLPDALYCVPWECMDRGNQRSVCFLLSRLQQPIHVTAMGMTPVGVTTMAGILKTTFSYYAFLKSMT